MRDVVQWQVVSGMPTPHLHPVWRAGAGPTGPDALDWQVEDLKGDCLPATENVLRIGACCGWWCGGCIYVYIG